MNANSTLAVCHSQYGRVVLLQAMVPFPIIWLCGFSHLLKAKKQTAIYNKGAV